MSITARRTKAGKTYYFVRVKSGRELIATKAFDTKRDAEAWERDQKHRSETGLPPPPKRTYSLQELVDEFLAARASGNPHTIDTDRHNIAALPTTLLRRPLASIHSGDIRTHLLRQLQVKKPSTVAREKTTLSALFTFAAEQGLLHQAHPVRTMKKIPELGAAAQRAISPKDVPSAARVVSALASVRERRSDIADVFEFMSLTGIRWGEARALRVDALAEVPFAQLVVTTKTWRGRRTRPLSPRALERFRRHSLGKSPGDYLFTNHFGDQLSAAVVNKFPLGFERHALRHYAASTWLRLGTPVNEVAEYLGDDPRTVLTVYAHILGEGQRRAHAERLAAAEACEEAGDTWGTPGAIPGPKSSPVSS